MDSISNFQVLNKIPSLSRIDVFLYFLDVISGQIDRYKIIDFNNNNFALIGSIIMSFDSFN